jgi:hypothetical protein
VNVLFSRPEEIEEVQAHVFTGFADAQEDKVVADAFFRSDSLDDPPERGKVFDGVPPLLGRILLDLATQLRAAFHPGMQFICSED